MSTMSRRGFTQPFGNQRIKQARDGSPLIDKRCFVGLQQSVRIFLPGRERISLPEFAAARPHVQALLAELLLLCVLPRVFLIRNRLYRSIDGRDLFRFWFVRQELEPELYFFRPGR